MPFFIGHRLHNRPPRTPCRICVWDYRVGLLAAAVEDGLATAGVKGCCNPRCCFRLLLGHLLVAGFETKCGLVFWTRWEPDLSRAQPERI
ncbi:hypothetical protein V6N12_066750 [Hibiscus sabdariffa]|uniref:Uncharacterized protein n=1 Tax=Hibiscus sabdariffa TaxID=183260 RepID=A0ABR2BDL5_9ROSI